MNVNAPSGALGAFDPHEIIKRAKSRRSFTERFDSFSDIYVWVLAALVALTYLFSALFGLLFVLLGQGVPYQELPTTMWALKDLALVLLLLLGLGVFRLMYYLGPCGLSVAKAEWWLPLPMSALLVRKPAWRKAMLMGLFSSVFLGTLWLILMLGIFGSIPIVTGILSLATFALGGIAIANISTVIQSLDWQAIARRIIAGVSIGIALLLTGAWILLWARWGELRRLLDASTSMTLDPLFWGLALAIALLTCIASSVWAYRNLNHISGQALREAGIKQQATLGSMMQGDMRGVVAPTEAAVGRRRFKGRRVTAKFPVLWHILTLRMLRGGRWHSAALYLVVIFALAVTVQNVANPLSAAAFYLGLCLLLTLSISGIVSPLLAEQQLTQHLGLPDSKINRAATLFAVLFSIVPLTLLTFGFQMLGMIDAHQLGQWTPALLLAALGTAAASSAHAQKPERDWNAVLGDASNDATIGAVIFLELVTYIRAMASYAPVIYLILSPNSVIPWALWGCAVLFAVNALVQIFRTK